MFNETLNHWRGTIKHIGWTVSVTCQYYNWLTNPAEFRTEEEHYTASRLAVRCRERLEKMPGWYETESGRVRPTAGGYTTKPR